MELITLENFSERNRERKIGNSTYRICKAEYGGKFYIHETYVDKSLDAWGQANFFHSDDLKFVIDKINSFTKEKEVLSHFI